MDGIHSLLDKQDKAHTDLLRVTNKLKKLQEKKDGSNKKPAPTEQPAPSVDQYKDMYLKVLEKAVPDVEKLATTLIAPTLALFTEKAKKKQKKKKRKNKRQKCPWVVYYKSHSNFKYY